MISSRSTPWLFLLPALTIYGVFGLLPILQTFQLSFMEQVGIGAPARFIGFANYLALLDDEYFLNAFKHTVIWIVTFLIVPTSIALALAAALKANVVGGALLKTVFFIPLAMSFAVIGIIWGWIYQPNIGLLDQVFTAVGLPGLIQPWLGPDFALFSVMAAAAWRQTAFSMVIFLAGLSAIPQELLEAASIDGASPRQVFWRITIPLLKPAFTVVISSTLISALLATEIVLTMTRGGPFGSTDVLGYRMYEETFWNYNFGYGATIGVVVTLLTALIVVPYLRRMTIAQERDWS